MNKRDSLYVLAIMFSILTPCMSLAQTTTVNDGTSLPPEVHQAQIRGWRDQSGGYQQQIAALGDTAQTAVSMPVLFGVNLNNISPNFGDPRDNGTRTHEGEDIMAVKGTPIVSPTVALVLRTGVGPSEGNYVYTANPGGETFVYMHLDRIGEGVVSGTSLRAGDLIGYVGNTGNAAGGPAHLHFEIHNSSGTPTDPFPRLQIELSLQEKINDLTNILAKTSDPSVLAQFLVTNFRSTFTAASQSGIPLPQLISDFLASIPAGTSATQVTNSNPSGYLDLGSSGLAVINLQQLLIAKKSGPAAIRLSQAGATGNFGSITLAALIEFQTRSGITPDGLYGPSTKNALEGATVISSVTPPLHTIIPGGGVTTPVPTPVNTIVPGPISVFSRNLSINMYGEDVRALQILLNHLGFTVSLSGAGSKGNESAYFGVATRAAVIRYQVAHNITPAVGYVGTITRAMLAKSGV